MNDRKNWRWRILVVDEEQLIALTLSAILDDAKYQVATTFSGEEAVEMGAIFLPDLLLIDIGSGAKNGIDAAIRITATQPECKVLFVSGQASMWDSLRSSREHAVYRHISKQARIPELLNAIANMLPSTGAVNGHPAGEVEHSTQLQCQARTELVGIDACRTVRPAWSREKLEQKSTSNGAEGSSTIPVRAKQLLSTRRYPVEDDLRTTSLLRAESRT